MLDFIPFEYYRNICEENGVEFTDRQRAAIVYCYPDVFSQGYEDYGSYESPLFTKLETLETIASKTDDIELKDEINGLIAFYKNKLERFKDNSDKNSVYLVERDFYFSSYEKAYEFGMSDRFAGFMMVKLPLNLVSRKEHRPCDALFNSRGELLKFNIDYCEVDRFSCKILNRAVPFKNPFERGDIVRDCLRDMRGVVLTSKDRWEKMINLPVFESLPFNTIGLQVEFITPSGSFEEKTVPVLQLEKQEIFDKDGKIIKDGNETKVLACASNILRGDVPGEPGFLSFDDLFYWCDKMNRDYKNYRL